MVSLRCKKIAIHELLFSIKGELVAYRKQNKSGHSFCGRFVQPFLLTPFL